MKLNISLPVRGASPWSASPLLLLIFKFSVERVNTYLSHLNQIFPSTGEGSYGSVFKALHKESGQVLAIKQVPVESDLGRHLKFTVKS